MEQDDDSCDGECSVKGRCNPLHPIHCCHFVKTTAFQSDRPGYVLLGFMCVKCKRPSRTVRMVRQSEGPCI